MFSSLCYLQRSAWYVVNCVWHFGSSQYKYTTQCPLNPPNFAAALRVPRRADHTGEHRLVSLQTWWKSSDRSGRVNSMNRSADCAVGACSDEAPRDCDPDKLAGSGVQRDDDSMNAKEEKEKWLLLRMRFPCHLETLLLAQGERLICHPGFNRSPRRPSSHNTKQQ